MVDKEFEAIIELKIQDLVSLIMEVDKVDFQAAIQYLYDSKLYTALLDESTKLWHLSVEKMLEILHAEKTTNKLIYPDFV